MSCKKNKLGFLEMSYGGVDIPIWDKQFRDETEFIPKNNMEHIKDTNLFLAHGTNYIIIEN